MKLKDKKLTLSVGLMLIFFISLLFVYNAQSEIIMTKNENRIKDVITSGIYIHNDAELAGYAVSGDGGAATPWIIRDLEIDTSDTVALRIEDTTEHFEVRNCTITAMYGIYLDNVSGGTARIENNTVYDCNSVAIYLKDTNGTWVEDNILTNNHRSIEVNYCYVTHILNNYCQSRDAGIFLRYSPYSSLAGNQMYGDGLEVLDSSVENLLTIAVSSTTVNDKQLYFSKNDYSDILSGDYGQLIVINGTDLIIANKDISDIDICFSFWYSKDIIVGNCNFENAGVGIELILSERCIIEHSTFYQCSDGIYIDEGYKNNITLNRFEQCSNGLYASNSYEISVIKNDFYNNSLEGVYLDTCYDSLIYWNNFTDNNQEGIAQGYDYSGSNNTWYNSITQEGNYWNDLSLSTYPIDGSSGSVDMYPLTSPYIIVPELNQSISILIVISILINLFIIVPILRRKIRT